MRGNRGQASLEYAGLLALVCAVLTGIAALTSGGLGPRIVHAIRLGVCTAAHTACPDSPPEVADLSPCVERRDEREQDFAVSVAVVALGAGLSVLREQYSDGGVKLTFVDDGHAGATAAIGAGFSLGGAGARAEASADASVGWTKGRTWRFRSARAADAFQHRYGSDQRLAGRLADDARRACGILCAAVGLGVDEPPTPDERYDEVGVRGSVAATLDWLDGPDAEYAARAALGWRRDRRGGGSLYVDLGAEGSEQLMALGAGVWPAGRPAGTIEVEYDARHRPTALRLTGAGAVDTGTALPGLAAAQAGEHRLLEVGAELDLRDGDGRRLVGRLLHALRPDRRRAGPGELAVLLGWMRAHATLSARAYRTTEQRGGVGARTAAGPEVAGSVGSAHSTAGLIAAWTRLPGLRWLPRADCRRA